MLLCLRKKHLDLGQLRWVENILFSIRKVEVVVFVCFGFISIELNHCNAFGIPSMRVLGIVALTETFFDFRSQRAVTCEQSMLKKKVEMSGMSLMRMRSSQSTGRHSDIWLSNDSNRFILVE